MQRLAGRLGLFLAVIAVSAGLGHSQCDPDFNLGPQVYSVISPDLYDLVTTVESSGGTFGQLYKSSVLAAICQNGRLEGGLTTFNWTARALVPAERDVCFAAVDDACDQGCAGTCRCHAGSLRLLIGRLLNPSCSDTDDVCVDAGRYHGPTDEAFDGSTCQPWAGLTTVKAGLGTTAGSLFNSIPGAACRVLGAMADNGEDRTRSAFEEPIPGCYTSDSPSSYKRCDVRSCNAEVEVVEEGENDVEKVLEYVQDIFGPERLCYTLRYDLGKPRNEQKFKVIQPILRFYPTHSVYWTRSESGTGNTVLHIPDGFCGQNAEFEARRSGAWNIPNIPPYGLVLSHYDAGFDVPDNIANVNNNVPLTGFGEVKRFRRRTRVKSCINATSAGVLYEYHFGRFDPDYCNDEDANAQTEGNNFPITNWGSASPLAAFDEATFYLNADWEGRIYFTTMMNKMDHSKCPSKIDDSRPFIAESGGWAKYRWTTSASLRNQEVWFQLDDWSPYFPQGKQTQAEIEACLASTDYGISSDCFGYDKTTGFGGAKVSWNQERTDGSAVGPLPTVGWCINFDFEETNGLKGAGFIDYAKGNFDRINLENVFESGFQVCAMTCDFTCSKMTSCGECTMASRGYCNWCGDAAGGRCMDPEDEDVCDKTTYVEGDNCPSCAAKGTCSDCAATEGCGWCHNEASESQCRSANWMEDEILGGCAANGDWAPNGYVQIYDPFSTNSNACDVCTGPKDSGDNTLDLSSASPDPRVASWCNDNGDCDWETKECTCDDGWAGPACDKQCPGTAAFPCSGNGECTPDGLCCCDCGWQGAACDVKITDATVEAACANVDGVCYHKVSSSYGSLDQVEFLNAPTRRLMGDGLSGDDFGAVVASASAPRPMGRPRSIGSLMSGHLSRSRTVQITSRDIHGENYTGVEPFVPDRALHSPPQAASAYPSTAPMPVSEKVAAGKSVIHRRSVAARSPPQMKRPFGVVVTAFWSCDLSHRCAVSW